MTTMSPPRATPTTTEPCAVCGGPLIRGELDYGTCGHCGGRSKVPAKPSPVAQPTEPAGTREQIAELTGFKTEPNGPELDRLERLYIEEGFAGVQAVAKQGVTGRGWDVSIFAASSPYQDGPK